VATTATGGVYTYSALEEGLLLRTRILIRAGTGVSPAQLTALLQDHTVRLGRAKKDEYGEARVVAAAVARLAPHAAARDELVVLCTSDVVLLDDALRPAPTPGRLVAALNALGVAAELVEPQPRSPLAAAAGFRRADGWSAAWGLPRPTVSALAAGTVLRLRLESDVPGELLDEIACRGVGERRAEGFGRLAFEPECVGGEYRQDRRVGPDVPLEGDEPDDRDARVLAELRLAWTRRETGRAVEHLAASRESAASALGLDEARLPTNHQLGALRDAAAGLSRGDTSAVDDWVRGLAAVSNRRAGWPSKAIEPHEGVIPGIVRNPWKLLEKHGLNRGLVAENDETRRAAAHAVLDACARELMRESR